MSLDAADTLLIRQTRRAFTKAHDESASQFYAALFREAPELRPLFPADLSDQGRKLMATLALAIEAAADWDRLGPALATLARRHLAYGAERHHYGPVGRALLATVEQAGATEAEVAAWSRVYARISAHMIAAAYPETDPALERG